jgi:hypothetical protein
MELFNPGSSGTNNKQAMTAATESPNQPIAKHHCLDPV